MPRFLILIFISMGVLFPKVNQAAPNFREGQLIIDAETNWIMRQYISPVFMAAGVHVDNPKVYIIVDADLNAFATPGSLIFVHTGLLFAADSALELLGVLAHETGHIARHHIVRRIEAYKDAQKNGMALGGLGLLLGLLGGSSDVAMAGWMGGMDAAQKSALHFTRGQEASADQAALLYLDQLQWSAEGLYTFFKRLERQELLPAAKQSKFLRSHPLTQDRMQYIRDHIERSPYKGKGLPAEFESYYKRLRAKVYAYVEAISDVKRRFPASDQSLPAKYARAIVAYREGRLKEAQDQVQALIKQDPDDPFFYEFLGQLQFEEKQFDAALKSYAMASKLLPDEPLFYLALAQIHLEKNSKNFPKAQVQEYLNKAISLDASPIAWYFVAVLEGKQGNKALASLALAEKALLEENYKEARNQGNRALKLLKENEEAHRRAQDIILVAEEKEKTAS